MKNNPEIYKRVKINWGFILIIVVILVVIYTYMILDIRQWINYLLVKMLFVSSIIFIGVISIVCVIVGGRSIVIIDDKFVIVRANIYKMFQIKIANIQNVITEGVVRVSAGKSYFSKKNFEKISFDFEGKAVYIQMKNGKIYQININDVQIIKEEIEKRMLTNKI